MERLGFLRNSNVNLQKIQPYKHYLARNLKPSIAFEVEESKIDAKRVVLLAIPAAKSVPTKFLNQTFIRIGSSTEKLSKFPEWEI